MDYGLGNVTDIDSLLVPSALSAPKVKLDRERRFVCRLKLKNGIFEFSRIS